MTTSEALPLDVSTAAARVAAATTSESATTAASTTVILTTILRPQTTPQPSPTATTTTTSLPLSSTSSTSPPSSAALDSVTTSSAAASTTFTSSVLDTSTSTFLATTENAFSVLDVSTLDFINQTDNATAWDVTEEERQKYLESLQEQTTIAFIPAMVFLVILALIGLIGNSLVLIVYSRKFTRTSTRIFIMAIAGFDLVTNVVVIPGEIHDMFHIWDFDQPYLCKTRLFFNAFTTMVSAMVLVAVAVVRYRKICHPFGWQVSVKMAKVLSIAIAITTLIFSIPYAIINGRQSKATPRPDIRGTECTIDDSYLHTIYPLLNSGFFLLLFVGCGCPLVILYILIGIKACRHSRVYGIVEHSRSGQESTSDSACAGAGTRSTDDHLPVHVTVSSRSRSYIKKKPGDTEEVVTARSVPEGQKDKDKDGNDKRNNKNEFGDDDANVIELVDENGDGGKKNEESTQNNNDYSVRMVRAPTGDKVHINLSMVRELTVKLKAVQKQTGEEEGKKEDGETASSRNSNAKVVKFDERPVTVAEIVQDEDGKSLNDSNSDLRKPLRRERNSSIQARSCKKHSKSMDDITSLVSADKHHKERIVLKPKAAESEDIDLVTPKKETANQEPNQPEEDSAPSEEEPMSDFARAMQWVDITYCLNETKDTDNDNGEDTDKQSKKGSFSVSRKVSRDNSFLQRHRTLRDALTDTLTRARKRVREREAAEVEGKDDVIDTTGHHHPDNDGDAHDENDDKRKKSNGSLVRKKSSLKDFFSGSSQILAPSNKDNGAPDKQSKPTNAEGSSRLEGGQGLRRRGLGRTTAMLITISAVYILGFLPFLALMITGAASPGIFNNLSLVQQSLYYLFLRSYFLNSAANPIVYSLCDINFRRQCVQVLKCAKPRPSFH